MAKKTSLSGPAEMPLLVTAAIVVRRGKVLITRRPQHKAHPGQWEFPGGKVEAGESPEQALAREIREELGVETVVGGIFEVVFHRYEWGPVLVLAYSCSAPESPIRDLGVAEHRWVTPAELHNYPILAADKSIVARLQAL